MSGGVESRTILLTRIGDLDESDLRQHFEGVNSNPHRKLVESVFIREGQDSAIVIFTEENFAIKAIEQDHGAIKVTQPSMQIFSSVSAIVHERIPHAVASETVWQLMIEGLMMRYGVDVRQSETKSGIEIRGSWLQVDMCQLALQQVYAECLPRCNGTVKVHANATEESLERVREEQGPAMLGDTGINNPEAAPETLVGEAGIDSVEEPVYCSSYRSAVHELAHPGDRHTAIDSARKTYMVASTAVHAYKCDITQLAVDVIVNAANGHLRHNGGVAAAIARAAGRELEVESRHLVRYYGQIDAGQGAMTTSGLLPCCFVYHVVGPMWCDYSDKKECVDVLHRAFTNCLEACSSFDSIAIPAVSSGVYGVPGHMVASVMCDAVTKFCHGEEHQSKLREIHLVDISAEIVALIQEEFQLRTTSGQQSARIASSRIIGVASDVWQRMTDVGVGSRAINKKPVESRSRWKTSAERGRHWGRSTSSLSKTDIARDNAKPTSRVFPSAGELDRLPEKASAMTRPGDERKLPSATATDEKTNECCADKENNHIDIDKKEPRHEKESYAAVAQGGATSHAKTQVSESDDVTGKHGDAASGADDLMCPICLEVPSKHNFCEACINECLRHKQECLVCRTAHGKVQGNQPTNGSMKVSFTECPRGTALPTGVPRKAIVINYSFPDGIQMDEHPHPGRPYSGMQRSVFLPHNQDGCRVQELLKKAFEQRLVFTVGRSLTSFHDYCVTWNYIHHKTNVDGEPENFGYPDPGYLQRVTDDLAAKGIR